MKVDINASGTLVIRAETHLEAYALSKWSESNFTPDFYKAVPQGFKLMVYSGTDYVTEPDPARFP